jgi:hypothetical protein
MLEEGLFMYLDVVCEETSHIRILEGRYTAMCTQNNAEEHIQICIRITARRFTYVHTFADIDLYPDMGGQNHSCKYKYRCRSVSGYRRADSQLYITYTNLLCSRYGSGYMRADSKL